MKKLKLLMSVVVGLALLAGCANEKAKSTTDSQAQEIGGALTVVTNRTDGAEIFAQIEAGFKAKYPAVTAINWEAIGDYDQTMLTRLTAGEAGDVLFVPFSLAGVPAEYPHYFESLGTVTDLAADYLDVTEADYEEQVYGLPVALNALGIIYNEDVFQAAGITALPTTVADFLAAAEAIKAHTKSVPFYSNYQRVAVWAGALTSFGGEQYKSGTLAAGNAFAEGQPLRAVMDLFYELAKRGLIEADPITLETQTAQQQLAHGEIGMLMSGSQDVAVIQALGAKEESIKIMNFPVERQGKTSLPLGAPAVIGISKDSQNKATARAFLDYFIAAESGYAADLHGMTPVKGDLTSEQQGLLDASNVILTVPTEKEADEARYNQLADEVGVGRLTDVLQQVINIGLYPTKNISYDDYVASLTESWAQAVKNNEK